MIQIGQTYVVLICSSYIIVILLVWTPYMFMFGHCSLCNCPANHHPSVARSQSQVPADKDPGVWGKNRVPADKDHRFDSKPRTWGIVRMPAGGDIRGLFNEVLVTYCRILPTVWGQNRIPANSETRVISIPNRVGIGLFLHLSAMNLIIIGNK